MGDEEEKRKETEAAAALKAAAEAEKAAKEKRIMPFALQPDANQLVKLAANQDADERKRTTELVLELVGGMVRRIATRTGVVAAVREADDTGAMEDEDGDGAMVRTREQRDEEDGGYDEAADGDALMRLEGGSVRWLYALSTGEASVSSLSNSAAAATGTKRKRITNGDGMEEDSTAVVVTTATTAASLATIREMFKGSRGFWTTFIARFIAHAGQLDPSLDYAAFTFHIKSRVLVAFILEDFPGRWDFAVRWLWEEMYHAARSGNDYAEYDYWLCVLLDQLFRTAEHGSTSAQLQASTYIPWFVHQNESALFRKFILALPRLPTAFWESAVVAPPVPVDNISIESVASPGYLLSLLETPVNKPLPTPLQKLRIQLGMELLYDFIIVRPSTRKLAIAMLLGYCIHADRARRSEAIRVARRFWTKSDEAAVAAAEGAESSAAAMVETSGALAKRIADRLEGFAMKSLRELSASPKVEAGVSLTPAASTDMIVDGAPGDNDDDIETTTSTEQPAPQPDWTEDQVARQLDLFMVMAVRDPLLLRHLFALYPTLVSDVVKRTILSMLGRTIAQIGMPRADNPTSLKLVEALDLGVDEGSELLLLRVLQMLHASLKTKGGEEDGVATRMSVEVTAYVRRQLVEHPSRYSNPLFWAYILTGEGLATEDIVRGVVMLLSVIDEDPHGYLTALADEGADASTAKDRGQQLFVSTISRLLTIQQADARSSKRGDTRGLSPVDLLVLLHSVETSPPFPDLPAITTRQMVTAITLCLQNPALSTHFTYSMYANALERLLDRHMADLPKIVMSTLRHVARKYRELHGFTVDVLTKIANTRIFKGRGRMEGYGKAMWEYWVRCMEVGGWLWCVICHKIDVDRHPPSH